MKRRYKHFIAFPGLINFWVQVGCLVGEDSSGLLLAVLKYRVSTDCLLTTAISSYRYQKCVRSWLSCHSKVWSFWRCTVMLLLCCTGLGRATHLRPHLHKRRLILLSLSLMKSHKPSSSPFPSPSPPRYLSSSQHLWGSGAWAPWGWQVLVYPRRDGVFLGSPRSFTSHQTFYKPHRRLLGLYTRPRGLWTHSLPFSFIFSQRLCQASLRWGTCRFRFFFKTGLEVLSAPRGGGVIISLQYWELFLEKRKNTPHTYSMFGSRLMFQPCGKNFMNSLD